MRVRKKNPGSSSHGHEWTKPGQVLDVPVEDATELVRINPGEFEVVDGGKSEPVKVTEPAPEADSGSEGDDEPKKPAGRGRRRVTED